MFQSHRVHFETFSGKQGIVSQNKYIKYDLSEV